MPNKLTREIIELLNRMEDERETKNLPVIPSNNSVSDYKMQFIDYLELYHDNLY